MASWADGNSFKVRSAVATTSDPVGTYMILPAIVAISFLRNKTDLAEHFTLIVDILYRSGSLSTSEEK
jgi:hypothetical protein